VGRTDRDSAVGRRGQSTPADGAARTGRDKGLEPVGRLCGWGRPVLRVTRSLYARAVGYNYEAVKIFMPANREKPVIVPYIEHVPPDVTACIFWLKNRHPEHWRDSQQMEHVLGKYIISDKPMSEEEWARERATVIDDAASPLLPQSNAEKPNKTKGILK
jgi:hypothetical protein